MIKAKTFASPLKIFHAKKELEGLDRLVNEMYQCQTANCGYIYNLDKGDRKGKIQKGA
jgi:hypothetical protein